MLDLEFAQLTDPGLVRTNNEDYLGFVAPETPEEARTRGWLFALADGVGGQDHGEVASRLAIEHLISGFKQAVPGAPLTAYLPRLIQAANSEIYECGASIGNGRAKMATTIVACALQFDRATVAHAGDSRCYLIRQQYAVALTRDHTVSGEQLRMGLVTAREAAGAVTANLLSRSLGTDMFISVDTSEHQIFPDDVLLLCSDGLHHSVPADDIARLVDRESDLQQAAADLVALAKARDGSDNISVQLMRIRGVERVGMYRGRHYKIH